MSTLFVIQGPSGAGKTRLQAELGLQKIVSITSRAPRDGEVDGQDYHFRTREQIEEMEKQGKIFESSYYSGNIYATPNDRICDIIKNRRSFSIVVDNLGANKFRENLRGKVISIGIYSPYEHCEKRLIERGKDSTKRLSTYYKEIEELFNCDIIINNSNDHSQRSIDIIHTLNTGNLKE